MKKQGFTLAEMVITLGVIAFIAVAVLGVLQNIVPNQEQVMLKKAYYLAGRVVNELVNDDDIYPADQKTANYLANTQQGYKNGEAFPKAAEDKTKKFCEAFASTMNINGDVKCTQHSFNAGQEPSGTFTTTDGMVWELPITNFGGKEAKADEWKDIIVDVNGAKGGNCFYGQKVGGEDCATPDRFVIQVNYLGRLNIPDSLAREYLNKTSTQDNFRKIADRLIKDKNVITYIPASSLAESTGGDNGTDALYDDDNSAIDEGGINIVPESELADPIETTSCGGLSGNDFADNHPNGNGTSITVPLKPNTDTAVDNGNANGNDFKCVIPPAPNTNTGLSAFIDKILDFLNL